MDMAKGRIVPGTEVMRWTEWSEETVCQALTNIKRNKQSGPDHIKGYVLRWFAESGVCLKTLTRALNEVMLTGQRPSSCEESKTVMVPIRSKPAAEHHRPIALINSAYKQMMGLVTDQVYNHLVAVGEINDLHAGFMRGRRMKDNLFMLDYCIRESKKRKKELIVMAVYFEKACDSFDRCLIGAMTRCKCDPRIIDIISKLYMGDSTQIYLGESFLAWM